MGRDEKKWQRFRKKPLEVEAMQYLANVNEKEAKDFCKGKLKTPEGLMKDCGCTEEPDFKIIETLEGAMMVNNGDYIIRGVNGEVYPCKPDIFHATYEAADD